MSLRRREFLDLVALLIALPACKEKPPPAKQEPTVAPAGALDPQAYRTFDAAAARILPGDATFAGARETGVAAFIDQQLTIAPMSKLAPLMIALAHALDDAARARGGSELGVLPPAKQDEVLDALARGALGTKLPERELFRLLHTFVLEGFLSDPRHGGNHEQRGWRAIDFPEPHLRTPGGHHS